MSARKARTEAAAAGAAHVDSEEKDVKIPVEAVDDTEANEAAPAGTETVMVCCSPVEGMR